MTKIEKYIIGVILFLLVSFAGGCVYTMAKIESEGGIKKVIINTGKEVKDIVEEINND